MDNRKYLLAFLFLAALNTAKAQAIKSFDQADSLTSTQYQAANWEQLIATGKQAIDAGFDSPALRQRLGYAQLFTGNYSAALKEYAVIFKNNSYNQTARYYAYLCHKYLNQELAASYNASYLDTAGLKRQKITPYRLLSAGFETGLKTTNNTYRNMASYTRVYLSNRLSWRWQLEQSVGFFNQQVSNNTVQIPGTPLVPVTSANKQLEYYSKLSYSLSQNTQLMGAYHYLHTSYETAIYNNHVGFAGLRYGGNYFTLQGDINMGSISGHHVDQYSGMVMFYPFGNLDLYTISRVAYLGQNNTGQTIFNQSLGFKLAKNTWTETSGTFGKLNNYIDADGLYIYNALDETTLKLGETLFYQLSKYAQIQLNYTYETKEDYTHGITYDQNSITAGLLWKF